jgi:signal transduction histidine kinase
VAVFAGVLVIGVRSAAPVEAARRRLQELTADASHELRTPLTVIEAEIDLARSGPPDAVADREALDHVARESRRLKSIVEDLLWLARFDTAPPEPPRALADLTAVATAGVERFGPVAEGRGVALTATIDGSPVLVDAAGDWLDRLTGTLLDNACRYVPAGGHVHVTATASGGRAVLRVEDDGPGIPAAQRDALFDRFRRATDTPGGAGLGLAIADSVVRSTGGRWRVDDSPLGGASMEISWRVRTVARAQEADGGAPDGGPAPTAHRAGGRAPTSRRR